MFTKAKQEKIVSKNILMTKNRHFRKHLQFGITTQPVNGPVYIFIKYFGYLGTLPTPKSIYMQPAHKYLSNLTTLRGVAAIWVIVFHFQVLICQFVLPQQSLLIEKGYLMVDLFFIMSGFIICHVYQQSFQAGITIQNFKKF